MTGTGYVAVLGMHRSGTSATAGMLLALGLAGPAAHDLVPASESNERGHFESRSLAEMNAGVLETVGAAGYAPPGPDDPWPTSPAAQAMVPEAAAAWDRAFPRRPAMWKDPRLCCTLPFWRTVLPPPRGAVLVVRDPAEVARSLNRRDGVAVLLALAMWDRYLRCAVRAVDGLPTLLLGYDALLADPARWAGVLGDFLTSLGLPVPADGPARAAGTLDAQLRHERSTLDGYEAPVAEEREVLDALRPLAGRRTPRWEAPTLPGPGPWVADMLDQRRELERLRHELFWVRKSRVYKTSSMLWRLTGSGRPAPEAEAAHP